MPEMGTHWSVLKQMRSKCGPSPLPNGDQQGHPFLHGQLRSSQAGVRWQTSHHHFCPRLLPL